MLPHATHTGSPCLARKRERDNAATAGVRLSGYKPSRAHGTVAGFLGTYPPGWTPRERIDNESKLPVEV